jgi:uncharacterized membrane protein YphA (DoxX/SURF4 family)
MSVRRWLVLILRVALGAVFVYAAYTKLRQPWLLFAMSIDAYGLLPQWAVLALARSLPWCELAIGALLLGGLWLRQAALAASSLLVVFLGIMLRSFSKGLEIDCGCFGLGEALSLKTLVRDGLLVVSSMVLTVLAFFRHEPPPAGQAVSPAITNHPTQQNAGGD